MSTFKKNLAASYASQIYVAIVGIVIVPVYIRYMGTEAYGLVGFYAMLQAWFQLLDMGLSPTLSRQTARLSGGAISGLQFRRLLRVLESIFIGLALIGASLLIFNSAWLATDWLQSKALPTQQVRLSIEMMAGIIGLRWIAGLYRSAIAGFEQQVWLGNLNASTATARFVVVLAIFEWIGTTPAHFFGWQLSVAAIETLILVHKTYRLIPKKLHGDPSTGFHWYSLKGVLGFSISIAFTSAVWVAVTQADKLILSKILTLTEYGYFTLATLVASGVTIVCGPLSNTLMPRLARLHAQGDEFGLIQLYRQSSQGMAAIALPFALVIGLCSEQLLLAWTGDQVIATQAAPVLRLYAIGNGILALGAFPYYLQFAKGDVRLHLIGNVLLLAFLVPSVIALTLKYGGNGAGWAWVTANIAYFIIWTWKVHNKFAPNLHKTWLIKDLIPIVATTSIVATAIIKILPWPNNRISAIITIAMTWACVFLAGVLSSGYLRSLMRANLRPSR